MTVSQHMLNKEMLPETTDYSEWKEDQTHKAQKASQLSSWKLSWYKCYLIILQLCLKM